MSRLRLILAWLVLLSSPPAFAGDKAAPHPSTVNGRFPEYSALAAGPWQPRLLPGCHEFTFSMYGCPGNVDELEATRKRDAGSRLGQRF